MTCLPRDHPLETRGILERSRNLDYLRRLFFFREVSKVGYFIERLSLSIELRRLRERLILSQTQNAIPRSDRNGVRKMATVKVTEGGLSEAEVAKILGKKVIQITEAEITQSKYDQKEQIKLKIQESKTGLEFMVWINTKRNKDGKGKTLGEVCAAVGLDLRNDFDPQDLVGKKCGAMIESKLDGQSQKRAYVASWIFVDTLATKAAPVAAKPLDEEGIPF